MVNGGNMRNRFAFLAVFAAALAIPCQPALAAEPGAERSAEQIAANDAAQALGERIYRHDQAALNASAMLSSALDLARFPEVRGYVTEELPEGHIAVIFYAMDEGRHFAFAEFTANGSVIEAAQVHSDYREHSLAGQRLRLAAAREAALAQGTKEELPLCLSTAANFVTLTPDRGATGSDLVSVYILSAPTIPGRYPLGGHYRFDVDPAGVVVAGRAFADQCLDVPVISRAVQMAPDNYPMVHLMDAQPNAIHHFVARQMNLPLLVTAGGVEWTLDYRIADPTKQGGE